MPTEDQMQEERLATCALCRQTSNEAELKFCLANAGRFKGLVFCQEHQKRFNACAAMRWQPGKAGQYR